MGCLSLNMVCYLMLRGVRQSHASGAYPRIDRGYYRYTQVFAPKGTDFVALEPMTAPTSALTSGQELRVVDSGKRFHAAFRIGIQA